MDYFTWNNLIAGHFFRPEMTGLRVYLYVMEELLGEISGGNSVIHNFVESVKVGPPGLTKARALQELHLPKISSSV